MEYLCYNLDKLPLMGEGEHLLTEAESERYGNRPTYAKTARILLKQELERRTGIPAQRIELRYNEHGKPYYPGIFFNSSHSANMLCMAFHHADIGVDIQKKRPRARREELAKRIMCEEQLRAFINLGCPEDAFFECWCIAEALVKHAGATIWQAPDFPFILHPTHVELLRDNTLTVERFRPASDFYGAVAYTNTACT